MSATTVTEFEPDDLLNALQGYAHILELVGAGTRGGYQIEEDEMHVLADILRGLIRERGLHEEAARFSGPVGKPVGEGAAA